MRLIVHRVVASVPRRRAGNQDGFLLSPRINMTERELELFSTEELINELLRRGTFQGVIVHAREEARRRDWTGERMFSVRFNGNFETEEVGRLLEVVSRRLADAV